MHRKTRKTDGSGNAAREVKYEVLPNLIGYHLRRAQVAVFNDFARTTADFAITPGQFGVLSLIASNPGLSQSALARTVGIERSTMVAVIDALEARGLVERRRSATDRRSYELVLSDQGRVFFEDATPLIVGHDERIAGGLSDKEKRTLIDLLTRIAEPSG